VAREEDLVGGGEPAGPGAVELSRGAAADLGHAVDAGGEHDEDGGGDGAHHDGATPALEGVEPEHGQLPQRRPEEQRHRHAGLRRQHREQQLDHHAAAESTNKGAAAVTGAAGRRTGFAVWCGWVEGGCAPLLTPVARAVPCRAVGFRSPEERGSREWGEEWPWIDRVVKNAVRDVAVFVGVDGFVEPFALP
jgi:hypothetical protein